MTYKVAISDQAKADFKEIYQYLKMRFGKRSAYKFKSTYTSLLKSLAKFPLQYPAIDEKPFVRKCAAMTPTIVFYKIEGENVTLLYLKDGRQDSFQG